jgi:hypothetical protein
MERHFALVKNFLVEAIVVGDDAFVDHIKDQYQYVVEVFDDRPSPGHSYYPDTNQFVDNSIEALVIAPDPDILSLYNGTNDGFETWSMSKYSCSYADGVVTIGCKKYSAQGLLVVLHNLLVERSKTTSHFTSYDSGPSHGKFGVTWEDATTLYNLLKEVKF